MVHRPLESSFVGEMKTGLKLWAREAFICCKNCPSGSAKTTVLVEVQTGKAYNGVPGGSRGPGLEKPFVRFRQSI